jgi:hypothetical protein
MNRAYARAKKLVYETKKVQPGELNQRVKQIPVFPLNHKTKTF